MHGSYSCYKENATGTIRLHPHEGCWFSFNFGQGHPTRSVIGFFLI